MQYTRGIAFLTAFVVVTLPCLGQAGRAELFGTIQDPSGSAVKDAKIELQENATGARFSAGSGARGEYHLLGLPVDEYVLTVEKTGFRTYRQSGMMFRLGDQTALDIKLDIGSASDSVNVTAQAPLLQTASGSVSTDVDKAKVETLPLDGRNFIPLVALSPGVALPNGSLLPRINGSRPRTNEYIYDGISVLQPEPGQVVMISRQPLLD